MSEAQEDLRRLRAAARALVDALPRCWWCRAEVRQPATFEVTSRPTRICDACSKDWTGPVEHRDEAGRQLAPLAYAAPLRALLALLGGGE